jgi:hypothetical protein
MAADLPINQKEILEKIIKEYSNFDFIRLLYFIEHNWLNAAINFEQLPEQLLISNVGNSCFQTNSISACNINNDILFIALNYYARTNIAGLTNKLFLLLYLSHKKVNPILNANKYRHYLVSLFNCKIANENYAEIASPHKLSAISLRILISKIFGDTITEIAQFTHSLRLLTEVTIVGRNSILGDNTQLGNYVSARTQKIQIVIQVYHQQLAKLLRHYLPPHYNFDILLRLADLANATKKSLGDTNIQLGFTTWLGHGKTQQMIKYYY